MIVYQYIYSVMSTRRNYIIADPKAPRFTKEIFNILNPGNKDFFNDLKNKYPELKIYSNKQITKFIIAYNKRVSEEVINNRNGVKLLDGLGVIVAGACSISKDTTLNNINWKELQDTGTQVSHQNINTDNYIVKIKYSNELDKHMFENRQMWCFDADRNFSRNLAAEFKKPDGWKKYIVFTTKQHISHLFRKTKIKNTEKKEVRVKEILENYDEFAI